jgi:TIR domain
MVKRLFISWSRETLPVAQALRHWLEAAMPGLTCWVSSTSITPGEDWNAQLRQALTQMDAAVVCLGPSAAQSPWVMFEVGAIGHAHPFLPFLLQVATADLPDPVRIKQGVAGFREDSAQLNDNLAEDLLRGVGHCLGMPAPEPAPALAHLGAALNAYDQQRQQMLREIIERSEDSARLLAILHALARRKHRPKSLISDEALEEAFSKRHRTALGMLYLQHHQLIRLTDFDSLKGGLASLTAEGRMALRSFPAP